MAYLTLPCLDKLVKYGDKYYCWDKSAGKVVEVKITDVPPDQVPGDVLIAMLKSGE
ncbi:MAG: hypothetical protein LBK61_12260 [Spirochaetaceae bacterium]|jgi:hypothetical protein|nr:hypothetical protein [Spirochaetaceae bacterium]